MRIDYPRPEQVPQLRRLWQLSFGDSVAFIDLFFRTGYAPERCRCVTTDAQAAAALYWFDVSCEGQKMAYIYAVATHPNHRGKGLCRALIADTHALLAKQGYAGTLLVTDGDSLRQMYARLGYRDCSSVSEFTCAAGEALSVHAVAAEEYAALRRKLLPAGGVVQEGENLSYLESYARFYAGADFLLAAASDGDALHGTELLGNRGAAPGILGALGYASGRFRSPGDDVAFAMFRPLIPDAKPPRYLGLAFD